MTSFNPFEDRNARNIRNSLSGALVNSLDQMSPRPFRKTATEWLKNHSIGIYSDFIHDRLSRYEDIFKTIHTDNIDDPVLQAIQLWNCELFFECHDRLESVWQNSKGEMRKALKGFIQAAGAYVHLENGNRRAAERLGKKAVRHLLNHGQALPYVYNRKHLIESLEPLSPSPPRLRTSPQ